MQPLVVVRTSSRWIPMRSKRASANFRQIEVFEAHWDWDFFPKSPINSFGLIEFDKFNHLFVSRPDAPILHTDADECTSRILASSVEALESKRASRASAVWNFDRDSIWIDTRGFKIGWIILKWCVIGGKNPSFPRSICMFQRDWASVELDQIRDW